MQTIRRALNAGHYHNNCKAARLVDMQDSTDIRRIPELWDLENKECIPDPAAPFM
jgi:hypothetical protein